MSKIILKEFDVHQALKNIKKRRGDFNEVRDPWAEAEDKYLMGERLPKGWEKIERPDDEPLYRDADYNEYVKDEYGHFIPLESGNIDESGASIPENVREDFMYWATNEAEGQRAIGGPKNAMSLMWEYYFDDNDQALADVIQFYKDARNIVTEPDSQEDVWISEEIRRAINEWGYYQSNGAESEDEATLPLNEAYGIGYQGSFLRDGGWGPRFTAFPEDAMKFSTPQSAERYMRQNLSDDFGASVVSLPGSDMDMDESEVCMLKETIKSMIREGIQNMGGIQHFIPSLQQGDMMEKGHRNPEHSKKAHLASPQKKTNTKRAIVIKWLKNDKNAVNCAEIMRQLWHPSPEDEDTKRGEFYKKRDGAINKDTGARYYFTDEEINTLYRIKSSRI